MNNVKVFIAAGVVAAFAWELSMILVDTHHTSKWGAPPSPQAYTCLLEPPDKEAQACKCLECGMTAAPKETPPLKQVILKRPRS